eukprot:239457_1
MDHTLHRVHRVHHHGIHIIRHRVPPHQVHLHFHILVLFHNIQMQHIDSARSCRLMRQNGGYEEYNVLGFNGIRRVSNNAPIKEAIEIKVWTKGRRGKVLWWCAYGDTVGFDVQVHQFLKNEQEIQKQNTNNSNNNSNNKK